MASSRKSTKSKSPSSKFPRSTSKISIKTSNVKAEDIEDRRLKNWKKWLKNREHTCNRLKILTGRKSEDLLINSYEKIRPKIEIQNLIEAAALSVLSEKSKNEVNFWVTPLYLRNRRDPETPEIAVSAPKRRQNFPRNVSRVFLPELSQKEKSLDLHKTILLAKKTEYLRKKLKELSPQISKLNLKVADIDHVAVEGVKIPVKHQIILKIGEHEIIFDEDAQNPQPLELSMEFHTKKGETCEKVIYLENRTFKNLIWDWSYLSRDPQIARKNGERFFAFSEGSADVLPSRCAEFLIRYTPKVPGVHLESAILRTSPRLSPFPIILRLWGACEAPIYHPTPMTDYEDYLAIRYRNSVISSIISEVWDKVESPPPQHPPYALHFLESDVFAEKNPGFSYNYEIVEDLKKMFIDLVKTDPWAPSLSELQCHLLEVDDANLRSGLLHKYGKLCRGLRKPSRFPLLTNSKYQVVYNLVAGFASKFFTESEYLKSLCSGGKWSELKAERFQDDVSRSRDGVEEEEVESEYFWEMGKHSQFIRKKFQDDVSRSQDRVELEEWGSLGSFRAEMGRGEGMEANYSDGSLGFFGQGYWKEVERSYDTGLYYEIFYARIHELLGDTAERISAAIEGINHLNRAD